MIFWAEFIALAEDLTHDGDDIFGVAVILGKDQRLGDFCAVRKDLRKQLVSKSGEDGPDLVFGDDAAVKLVCVVLDFLISFCPP